MKCLGLMGSALLLLAAAVAYAGPCQIAVEGDDIVPFNLHAREMEMGTANDREATSGSSLPAGGWAAGESATAKFTVTALHAGNARVVFFCVPPESLGGDAEIRL